MTKARLKSGNKTRPSCTREHTLFDELDLAQELCWCGWQNRTVVGNILTSATKHKETTVHECFRQILYCCFLVFRRIGKYISLDPFYISSTLRAFTASWWTIPFKSSPHCENERQMCDERPNRHNAARTPTGRAGRYGQFVTLCAVIYIGSCQASLTIRFL